MTLPHSRACGIYCRGHGSACASDCPTCHGQPFDRARISTPLTAADGACAYIQGVSSGGGLPADTAESIYKYACGWSHEGWVNALRSSGYPLPSLADCRQALDILHDRAYGRPVGHASPLFEGGGTP